MKPQVIISQFHIQMNYLFIAVQYSNESLFDDDSHIQCRAGRPDLTKVDLKLATAK